MLFFFIKNNNIRISLNKSDVKFKKIMACSNGLSEIGHDF
jgi:hypothetical protein